MTIDPRRLAGMWRWLNSDGLDGPIALTVSSPLSVEEAVAALRANLSSRPAAMIDPAPLTAMMFGAPARIVVTGSVKTGNVRLTPHNGFRNSWQRSFHGRFQPVDGGSELTGVISAPRATTAFMKLWGAGVIVFMVISAILVVVSVGSGQWGNAAKGVLFLAVACLVGAGGFGIQAVGLRLSRRSSEALDAWVRVSLGTVQERQR
jgi:hypothetical protein